MWHNTTGEGDYKGVIGKRKDSRRLLSSMANFDGFQRHTIRGGGCSMISVVAMPRGKKAESQLVKYWEIIADNLSKPGWSWGCVSAIDSNGRTIWISDAHPDDGKRFVVQAEEKLTAFLELESAMRAYGELI
jgi:hypothetical protein